MLNRVLLIGRATRDAELNYTPSGKPVARFSLAVNREYKRDEVDFIRCEAWDRRAELAGNYVTKGRLLAIEGSLRIDRSENNGEKREWTKVVISAIAFLDSGKTQDGSLAEWGTEVDHNGEDVPF